MTRHEPSAKVPASGNEILGPIWNAIKDFVSIGWPGEVVLRFEAGGKLAQIEILPKKTQKL